MDLIKRCRVCDEVKLTADFNKKGKSYCYCCKVCKQRIDREYRAANLDKVRAKARQKYRRQQMTNPEGVRAKARENMQRWRLANPDKVKDAQRRHMPKTVARLTQWRKNNRERFLETQRQYRAANKDQVSEWAKAHSVRRRSQLEQVRCDFTPEQWQEMKRRYKYCCYYCGEKKPLTQDHVIPVVEGGEHTWANILPACKPCNSRKGRKDIGQFIQDNVTTIGTLL